MDAHNAHTNENGDDVHREDMTKAASACGDSPFSQRQTSMRTNVVA